LSLSWISLAVLGWCIQAEPPSLPVPVDGPSLDERTDVLETGPRGSKRKSSHRSHRFIPLPEFRQDPDTGTMFGARGSYAYRDPEADGMNKARVDLALRFSTKRVQQHELTMRLRDLARRQEIVTLEAEWMQEPVLPYFGIAANERIDKDDVRDDEFTLSRRSIGPSLLGQYPLIALPVPEDEGWRRRGAAYLRVVGGWRFRHDLIEPNTDEPSRFAEDYGTSSFTARRGSYVFGLSWDSRDNEWSPHGGAMHDVTLETGGPWGGGTNVWSRATLTTRWYQSLGTPKVIFAHLFVGEVGIGEPSFLTQGELGGVIVQEAIGGRFYGRGFVRRRFIGRNKLYTSAELRIEPFEWSIKGRRISPAIKGFVDVGEVIHRGDTPLHDLHVSGGGGFYLVWDEFFVIRVDAGFSAEGHGIYVTSNHAF
jgi:hypothetical protein